MRKIDESTVFRRDYKRERRGRRLATLDADLTGVLSALATDAALDLRLRDYALSGDWAGYRECHIRPDLLLIYQKIGDDILRLARLGSHNELFD